jgi:hypothetical protein
MKYKNKRYNRTKYLKNKKNAFDILNFFIIYFLSRCMKYKGFLIVADSACLVVVLFWHFSSPVIGRRGAGYIPFISLPRTPLLSKPLLSPR